MSSNRVCPTLWHHMVSFSSWPVVWWCPLKSMVIGYMIKLVNYRIFILFIVLWHTPFCPERLNDTSFVTFLNLIDHIFSRHKFRCSFDWGKTLALIPQEHGRLKSFVPSVTLMCFCIWFRPPRPPSSLPPILRCPPNNTNIQACMRTRTITCKTHVTSCWLYGNQLHFYWEEKHNIKRLACLIDCLPLHPVCPWLRAGQILATSWPSQPTFQTQCSLKEKKSFRK